MSRTARRSCRSTRRSPRGARRPRRSTGTIRSKPGNMTKTGQAARQIRRGDAAFGGCLSPGAAGQSGPAQHARRPARARIEPAARDQRACAAVVQHGLARGRRPTRRQPPPRQARRRSPRRARCFQSSSASARSGIQAAPPVEGAVPAGPVAQRQADVAGPAPAVALRRFAAALARAQGLARPRAPSRSL